MQAGPTGAADLMDDDAYREPRLLCDLVMKGGITSGVIYPKGICEIARVYRLRNVGGTSAGAVAAGGAAAAEVGRDHPGGGFARLARLPERFSKIIDGRHPVLFNLFQPADTTRPVFDLLTKWLDTKGRKPWRRVPSLSAAVVSTEPLAASIGSAFGIIVVAVGLAAYLTQPGIRSEPIAIAATVLAVVAGLLLGVVGMVAAAAYALAKDSLRDLAGNGFGICPGFAPGDPAPLGTPNRDDVQVGPDGKLGPKPLTTWLADEFDALAGKTDEAEPLTLGDLAAHGVSLKMFTTNLTDGTPYTLPFRSRKFFFAPEEFRDRFPDRIVRWMVDHTPSPRSPEEEDTFAQMRLHDPPLLPMPSPNDLPVVVITRMSLSFPFLLSAVPLWAYLWSQESVGMAPTQCWFSDGGITSNFPLHFFDSPLPRWPTFAMNLGPGEDLDPLDQCENIWAPLGNDQGIEARWGEIRNMTAFAHAILDTMQNWMDNAQSRVPGYRDRVVVVKHTDDEGGMNLSMPTEQIERLVERGRCAGRFFVNRFANRPSLNPRDRMGWENHRWLRYRTTMSLVEDLAIGTARGYDWVPDAQLARTYPELLAARDLPSYAWCSAEQRTRAAELTESLIELARDWATLPDPIPTEVGPVDLSIAADRDAFDASRPFACRAPRPRPAIRIVRDF
jgi:hypothetical protein